jgi:hypothetical protein
MGYGITMIGRMNPYVSSMLNGIPTKYEEFVRDEINAVAKMDSAHWRISGISWNFIKEWCYDLVDEIADDMYRMTDLMYESDWDVIENRLQKNIIMDDDVENDEEVRKEVLKIFKSLYEVREYRRMFVID